jgi:HAD superfamily hydrolase (TIGR01549 family)/HAD superfamily hydrolase (TIGR01509 family)
MKNIKGICFDLDQTLSNTEDYFGSKKDYEKTAEWQVYQYLKPHLKIVDWETFKDVYKQSKKEVKELLPNSAASHNRYLYIQRTLENFGLDFSPSIIYEATNIYWDYVIKNSELFPTVLDTVKALRRNHIKIAVITDLTADIQNLKLIELNINQYINYLVTSEEAGADKPNPKMVQLAVEKMGLSKEEVIVVGNNPKTDIQAAKNFNMNSVLFDYYSKYPEQERNEPNYYITRMSELLEIINTNTSEYTEEKLGVFDLMGTLTQEEHLISVTLNEVLPDMDYKEVKKQYELYKVDKISNKEFWNSIGVTEYRETEKRFLDKVVLKKGVRKELKKLNKHFKLSILSNSPKEWGEYLVNNLGLSEYFDEIVFSGQYGIKKPDPQIYKLLLDKFPNIQPEKVYFIDNDLEDLKSGKNYLMKTIWLRSEKKDPRYVPDYVVDNIKEVIKLIKE